MSNLLWPGEEHAGDQFTDASFLEAMVAVEQAWLDGLAEAGVAPQTAPLTDLVGPDDLETLAVGAESGGNPVIGLVDLLRSRSGSTWVHRGLTSQDVVDTALALCLESAMASLADHLASQGDTLIELAEVHRGTPMAGRTLTQYAVPMTFGLKAATWLNGVVAAAERLDRCPSIPAQLGGAAGTLAAPTLLTGSPERALALVDGVAARLRLAAVPPWHTERSVLTEYADALVACSDAWGHLAADVALLSRPEIGELREGSGGGSSTMPGKANPVLSILIRRHALAAPGLAATMHVAAGAYLDERPDGAWHAEWDTLRTLARRTIMAASQTDDLLRDLVVDTDRMAEHAAEPALDGERRSMARLAGLDEAAGAPYLGATDQLVDAAIARAKTVWKDLP